MLSPFQTAAELPDNHNPQSSKNLQFLGNLRKQTTAVFFDYNGIFYSHTT
jgi:hypothetical protein